MGPFVRYWRPVAVAGLVAVVVGFGVLIARSAGYLRGITPTAPDQPAGIPSEAVLCGPRSLWVAAQRLGLPVEWARMAEIPVDPAAGTTLGDLRDAAAGRGLRARTARVDFDELKRFSGAAILHVRGNHFVAVDPREPDAAGRLRVYDPGKIASWWSRDELAKVWDGPALLLERDAPAGDIPAGSRLTWENCWQDAGLLKGVENVEFRFPFRNTGSEPLTVQVASTSCNCTAAKVTPDVVPPGGNGVLTASVNLVARRGAFAESVAITSNDPNSSACRVILAGGVWNTEILSARKLHVGSLRPGQSVTRRAFVHDPGEGRLKVAGVRWEFPAEQARPRVAGVLASEPIAAGSPRLSEIGRYKVEVGDHAVDVRLTVLEDSPPGEFLGAVVIDTNLPAPHAQLRVEFEGKVLPDIDITPAAVLLAPADPTQRRVQVRLSSHQRRSFVVERVIVPDGLPVRVEDPDRPTEDAAVLTFVGDSSPSRTGTVTGTVVCILRDGRTVDIPVVVVPTPARPVTP